MAHRARNKLKTFPASKSNDVADAEKAKSRILKDFRKRLDSPNVRNLISMGNNGPKAENIETMIGKQTLQKEHLFPPPAHNLSSSSEGEENMDKGSKTATRVHRRKTKSERNKTRAVVTSKPNASKKPKNTDTLVSTNIKEKAAFKKSVKSVERNPKPKTEKVTDKSVITDNRLTVGLGFGLFNRKKKSKTASKDEQYVNSDLEIEVMPPEKTTNAFDIGNIYGKLKRSKGVDNLMAPQHDFSKTPQSVQSSISLKSQSSSNVLMDVDDHVSLSSESLPPSPDFEAVAAFVVTHDDVHAKFQDRDLIASIKADLRQIYKMRNPNYDPEKDFRTPLLKMPGSRGVSSEVVKRNLTDRLPPLQFSKQQNSTSTTQLNVLAHKRGVEVMHMQYHNQRNQEPDMKEVTLMPSRDDPAHVKLDLARTRLAENLDKEVWKHEQARVQHELSGSLDREVWKREQARMEQHKQPSSNELDISIKALTDAKTLLECNEKVANQAKGRMDSNMDTEFRFTKDEHAPMDFLDSLSAGQEFKTERTAVFCADKTAVNSGFEIFASTRDPQTLVQEPSRFENLYNHKRTNSAPTSFVSATVTNQKVITQYLPQDYNVTSDRFATTNNQPWIQPGSVQKHRSPRNHDFLDELEHESQTRAPHDFLKNPLQGIWKPPILNESPSPQHFLPHKMF